MRPHGGLVSAGKENASWMDLPAEIHQRTGKMLALDDRCRLSMTSKYHQNMYTESFSNAVKVMLSKFNLPVNDTTYEMQRWRAIIIGAAPLAIIDDEDLIIFEIDFCVPFGCVLEFESFVLTKTEYRPIGHKMEELYAVGGESGIRQVREYRHPRTAHVLRLLEAEMQACNSIVFLLPTTVAMTYITWNSIVCPYPYLTTKRISLLNSFRPYGSINGPQRTFLRKYASYGHTYVPDAGRVSNHLCGWTPNCGMTERMVCDNGCMRVKWNGGTGPLDLIDASMEWRLASRYTCNGVRNPVGVFIVSSNGESIITETYIKNGTLDCTTVFRVGRLM